LPLSEAAKAASSALRTLLPALWLIDPALIALCTSRSSVAAASPAVGMVVVVDVEVVVLDDVVVVTGG
jgi:hypothetical protein